MASENTRKWAIIPEPNSMTVGEGTVLLPYAGRVNESIAIGDGDYLLARQLVADIRATTGLDWDYATGCMWPGFISLHIADSDASEEAGIPGAYTLIIDTDGIAITGYDFEGVRNGADPASTHTAKRCRAASTADRRCSRISGQGILLGCDARPRANAHMAQTVGRQILPLQIQPIAALHRAYVCIRRHERNMAWFKPAHAGRHT